MGEATTLRLSATRTKIWEANEDWCHANVRSLSPKRAVVDGMKIGEEIGAAEV
jgi:hypothetical protein